MMFDMNKETFEKEAELVDITDMEIAADDGHKCAVHVIKPKTLTGTGHAAYIYAHGGGAVMFEAKSSNSNLTHTALELNCVVFNVDYRLGPESKAPTG